jgi:predicted enzyme related to lactoylglutathione lyase
MQVVKRYPEGVFCWVDLATTDAEAAKTFYTSLFGWDYVDLPTDGGPPYTMFQIEGHDVAALSAMSADTQAQGVPPVWTSYVKHDNVDAVAEKAAAAGGTILFPPFDVMDAGRMAMVQDPSGAMFGVWQPGSHIGAQLVNMPNALVWNELQTRDTKSARNFYNAVFGWEYDIDASGYLLPKQGGRIHAGIMQIDESWGDAPSNWAVYFMVEDVEAAAAKSKELGGTLLRPPSSAGEMGKFSVVQDPQGGVFTIMQFAGPADPPPGF